jgi:hypothetical protein
MGILQ